MADLMAKKNYDLTEITRLLLKMRENCVPKDGDAYEDQDRDKKYDALNAAIDLINNPSMVQKWKSVNDRLPEEEIPVLVGYSRNMGGFVCIGYLDHEDMRWCGLDDIRIARPTHWMPLPEPPKGE